MVLAASLILSYLSGVGGGGVGSERVVLSIRQRAMADAASAKISKLFCLRHPIHRNLESLAIPHSPIPPELTQVV